MSPKSRGTVSRRSGKYGAKRTLYRGILYDSKSEAAYASRLDLEKKAKLIREWDRQVTVPLTVNGIRICKMIVDFLVWLPDGTVEYREVKGLKTATFNLKLKLFRALYPDSRYVIVNAREALK